MTESRLELFEECYEILHFLEKQNRLDTDDSKSFVDGRIREEYVKLRELNGERLKRFKKELIELQRLLRLPEPLNRYGL
ncbi:MAG: hypothetical protein IIU14_00115 [Ruminococcus sp.]|nr:hypothetical protein [Ruminococcus sp.]